MMVPFGVSRWALIALTVALASVVAVGCTDRDIEPIAEEPPPPFDNKLQISGEICTEDPSELKFPLKVFFVIDTSQSMTNNDGRRTAPDPDLGETTIVDPTQATGRSRAVRDVIRQFIDLGIQYPPIYCHTNASGCQKGSESCAACASLPRAVCLGNDCCACGPQGPLLSGCQGRECCPPPDQTNGVCMPLCDTAADCPNENDRCLHGICSNILDPGVEFAIERFGSARQVVTRTPNGEAGFTNNPQELVTALPQINNSGSVTDYEGALNEAYATLTADMKAASRDNTGALNRTRYVVVFLSDGQPDPAVNDGEDWDDIHPTLRQDMLGDQAQFLDRLTTYNVSNKILRRVKDIMSLKALYGLGDMKVHTAFLTSELTPAHKQEQAILLLKQMSQIGKGTFRNFRNGEEINFLHVDFSSLRRVFQLKNLIVTNVNARPVGTAIITDSDGDGLHDPLEVTTGTDVAAMDTDGDGFSDTLEHFFRASGADPLDPKDADCSLAAADLDGDGRLDDTDGDELMDCEERFLGTSKDRFDSDADGVPDNIEVRFGTNPVSDDTLDDLDFDGMPNGDELRLHTDPAADDAAHRSRVSYRYDVRRTGNGVEVRPVACEEDVDCAIGRDCREGFCRCQTADDCSTLTPCTGNAACTRPGETCDDNSQCRRTHLCDRLADVPGDFDTCAVKHHITCYNYTVENITLVDPRGQDEDGWNTLHLYFAQAPFDDPKDQGVFSMACVRARYNSETGFKNPARGRLELPRTLWKDPRLFDRSTDCVCPDGQLGSCPAP